METRNFENLTQLQSIGASLPIAVEQSIFTNTKELNDYKAISDRNTGELACIAHSEYNVIQHQELINEIAGLCKELGLTTKGTVEYSLGKVNLNLLFNNLPLVKDSAQGIQIGLRVSNSWDKSTSLRFSAYGVRLACYNGMRLTQVLSSEVSIHRGIADSRKKIREMFTASIDKNKAFQAIVDKAMGETFSYEAMKIFITKMLEKDITFKHAAKILDKIGLTVMKVEDKKTHKVNYTFIQEKNFSASKWDLYNAFTNYLTHEQKLSYGTKEWLDVLSERVLLAPIRC